MVVLRQLGVECIPESSLRHVSVGDLCVSKDGRWAAAQMGFRRATSGGAIINDVVTYDFPGGTIQRLCLDQFQPLCVAISPTAESITIACADHSIYLCDGPVTNATSSEPAKHLRLLHRARDEGITRLIFSPDGRQLAAVGRRFIHLLRYPEGGLLLRLACADTTSLAFAEDSRRLILLNRDATVCWWDTSSFQQVGTESLAACQLDGTALSADGRFAAFMLSDGRVTVWSLEADTQLWQHLMPSFHKNAARALELSPHGSLLAHACWTSERYQISCYHALTGECLGQSPHYEATFKGMVVSSNDLVYSWDKKGVIRVWQMGEDHEEGRISPSLPSL